MPGWIWSNRTMISKSLQAKLSQSAVWKGWTKSTFLLRCEPAETQYYYFNIRENNFSNNCESITKIKDKMISLSFTVLGVMLPSLDPKEEKWNKTRPRYSMYDLQTHLCVDTSTHTDIVIVMQFLYSSGPQALCATLNQLWWLSSGPSTGGGKQEINAMFQG